MHDAFLAAIVAEPDEMTHRLVYADWLEEHGSTRDAARAELIRVQVARESADPDGDDYWTLRARERAALAGWTFLLAGVVPSLADGYRFRRGFVEWAAVRSPGWLDRLCDRDRFPELVWLDLHGRRVPEPWLGRLRQRFGRGVRVSPNKTRTPGIDDLLGD